MAHLDAIASQLPLMNASDLSKIQHLTNMLLGKKEDCKPRDNTETILFEAVRAELMTAGLRNNVSYSSLKDSKYYKSWQRGLETFSEFTSNTFESDIKSDAQRLGLYRILVQTIIVDLRRMKIPVSLGTVSTNLGRVQQTFDRSFPGYLQAGIAHLVPKALLKNQKA